MFHYRSVIDFNDEGLKTAQKQYAKLAEMIKAVESLTKEEKEPSGELKEIFDACVDAMNDDFNTPVLIAQVLNIIKLGNVVAQNKDIAKAKEVNFVVKRMVKDVLGLKFDDNKIDEEEKIDPEIEELAKARWQAKQERNWAEADRLREELAKRGYTIKDNKDGYEIVKN